MKCITRSMLRWACSAGVALVGIGMGTGESWLATASAQSPATGALPRQRTFPSAIPPNVAMPGDVPTANPGVAGPSATPQWSTAPPMFVPKIEPIVMEGDHTSIKLPAAVDEIAEAGGGRYLILHLPSLRQLAVFDICQAKVVKYIALASDDVAFAGGMDRIIVALRDKQLLQRWNLQTFERDFAVPMPANLAVSTLTMGHASTGPVLVCTRTDSHWGSVSFLDGTMLDPLNIEFGLDRYGKKVLRLTQVGYFSRAAANGRTFMVGAEALVINGLSGLQKTSNASQMQQPHNAMPNANSTVIYSQNGFYDNDMKRLGTQTPVGFPIPALQAGYYFLISGINPWSRRENPEKSPISFHSEGDARPLFSIMVPAGLSVVEQTGKPELYIHKRFYFLPDAHALVQLPTSNDELLVYRVDIEAELAKSPLDYIFVNSVPPEIASPGKTLEYQVKVRSKRGGVKYELSPPVDGMSISPTGMLQWAVPDDFNRLKQDVLISIKDDSGQEIFHSFALSLPDVTLREEARRMAQMKKAQAEQSTRQAEMMAMREVARAAEIAAKLPNAPQIKEAVDANVKKLLQPPPPPAPPEQPLRAWTDLDGNQVEARFVQSFGGFVTLRKESKAEFTALLGRMSPADQELVRSLTEATIAARKARDAEINSPAALIKNPLRAIGIGHTKSMSFRRRALPLYSVDVSGKPLLSWRVHLLPLIGGQELYELFRQDQPWDSEHNKKLIAYMPEFYRAHGSQAAPGKTIFLAVTGPECVYSAPEATPMEQIKDLPQQTAIIVEATDAQAVIWTKPEDFAFTDGAALRSLVGLRPEGFQAVMLDGSVQLISSANSDTTLGRLFTHSDGQPLEVK